MPVLIVLVALALLWWFVVWDRRRLSRRTPISREAMSRGVVPAPVRKWPVHTGLSLLCGVLGLYECLTPSKPPFTGQWSRLHSASYQLLGPYGVAYMWFAFAVISAMLALRHWRARSVVAPSGEL
jgi:hypothetical protein